MPKMNFPNHDYMRFKKSHSCKYNTEVDAEMYDNISGKNKTNNNPIYSMMKSFSVIYRLCKNMNIKNNRSCPIKT
jgi:primase-polymerase (primpol)-like protein